MCLLSQGVLPIQAQMNSARQIRFMDQQQKFTEQVTLRDAGIPSALVHRMGRAQLDMNYQKALEGTTWTWIPRSRHTPGHLQENPPPKSQLDKPFLGCALDTQTSIKLTFGVGPQGAPNGMQLRMMTRQVFESPNAQWTLVNLPPQSPGFHDFTVQNLTPDTTYVFQIVALGDNVHTTSGEQSDPAVCSTLPNVVPTPPPPVVTQLSTPTVDCNSETSTSFNAVATAGPTGAPNGMLVKMQSLNDYANSGFQFNSSVPSYQQALTAPVAPNGQVIVPFAGLTPSTSYVFEAIAVGNGSDQLQSCASNIAVCNTTAAPPVVVQLDAPVVDCSNETQNSIDVHVTAGPSGMPFGYLIQYAPLSNPLDVHSQANSAPVMAGAQVTANLTGLDPNTAYSIIVWAVGGNVDNTIFNTSNGTTIECSTLPTPELQAGIPTIVCDDTLATSSQIGVNVTAGANGAPGGVNIQYTTLADFQANGWTNATTTTAPPLVNQGDQEVVLLTGLDPSTTYVARAMAVGAGNVADSDFSAEIQCDTLPSEQVQAGIPTIACDDALATPSQIAINITAGANGAPGGVNLQYTTLADFQANGWINAVTTGAPPLVNQGDQEAVIINGLAADTTYVVRAMANGSGNVTDSDFSAEIQCSTLPQNQGQPIASPTLACNNETQTSTDIVVTAGADGAPGGVALQFTTLADFNANQWQNATSVTDTTPLAAGESHTFTVNGLTADTAYVFRAMDVASDPLNNSPWTDPITCNTLPKNEVDLDAPALECSNETTSSIDVTLTFGQTGAPLGWSMLYFPTSNPSNFQIITDTNPVAPGGHVTITLSSLTQNTSYTIEAIALGGQTETTVYFDSNITTIECNTTQETEIVQLNTPELNCSNETSSTIDLTTMFGPTGAPFGYHVEYHPVSDPSNSQEITINGQFAANSQDVQTIVGLLPNQQYQFTVYAIGGEVPGTTFLQSESTSIYCNTVEQEVCTSWSQGYWKTYEDVTTALINQQSGGTLFGYTPDQIIGFLNAKSLSHDGTSSLMNQTVATALNGLAAQAMGFSFEYPPEYASAVALLDAHGPYTLFDPPGDGHDLYIEGSSKIDPSESDPLTDALDSYIQTCHASDADTQALLVALGLVA